MAVFGTLGDVQWGDSEGCESVMTTLGLNFHPLLIVDFTVVEKGAVTVLSILVSKSLSYTVHVKIQPQDCKVRPAEITHGND